MIGFIEFAMAFLSVRLSNVIARQLRGKIPKVRKVLRIQFIFKYIPYKPPTLTKEVLYDLEITLTLYVAYTCSCFVNNVEFDYFPP